MRKLTFALFLLVALAAQAQTNLQLHYDLGKERKYFTSTLEMFKPDKWGNSFFFVDIDYNGVDHQPSLAYMEIARCLKFWNGPFSVHVEYNGGLLGSKSTSTYYPINNAYLAGIDYGWHDKTFTKFLNFKVLYKTIQGKNANSFQLTGVWNLNYFNKKVTLSGFADFWREDNVNFTNASGRPLTAPTNTDFVFISEPQFWYNVTPNLSLGSEVEVATNFGTVNGLKICPTLAAKWNF
jgi:hypothetical protein